MTIVAGKGLIGAFRRETNVAALPERNLLAVAVAKPEQIIGEEDESVTADARFASTSSVVGEGNGELAVEDVRGGGDPSSWSSQSSSTARRSTTVVRRRVVSSPEEKERAGGALFCGMGENDSLSPSN